MLETARAGKPATKEKIIIALDVETAGEARKIIDEIGAEVGAFKIGLQLFTACGASFVRELVKENVKLFLDVKFHDIPNTVAKASVEIARLGVWMFNIHTLGGAEMMRRTVEEVTGFCRREKIVKPKIIGVTILTSTDQETLRQIGIERELEKQVLDLARLSAECGLDGVVASPHEVEGIRQTVPGRGFLIITPGIRPGFATNDDQRRVMTPKEAVEKGSNFLVIGRPVTGSANQKAAVGKIIEEIENK